MNSVAALFSYPGGQPALRRWWFGVKRHPEILEHGPASVVDHPFGHFRPLAHDVHRTKVVADEVKQFEWLVFHGDVRFAVHLDGRNRRQAAHHHHLQRLGVQIAKVEPVRPRLVERRIEPANFRDGMNLAGIIVVAVNDKDRPVHHFPQPPAGGQFVRRIQVQKMAEATPLHFRAAELIIDDVVAHVFVIVTLTLVPSDSIHSAR